MLLFINIKVVAIVINEFNLLVNSIFNKMKVYKFRLFFKPKFCKIFKIVIYSHDPESMTWYMLRVLLFTVVPRSAVLNLVKRMSCIVVISLLYNNTI